MATRPRMTFSFVGLTPSDEAAFKSIVGLLGFRTGAEWTHQTSGMPNLHISQPHTTACQYLRAVVLGSDIETKLSLPLRVFEVFTCLQDAETNAAAKSNGYKKALSNTDSKPVSISKWPDAKLLARSTHYMRLVTALSTRPMAASELAKCVGVSKEVACELIGLLLSSGYAKQVEPATKPITSGNVKASLSGLFSKVRAHLGLSGKEA